MKEITRISLAQLPYNIEVAAKKELEKYLNAIERSLNADADTMKEIEARIAELLAEHGVAGEKVIGVTDVETIKTQLGDPKEFLSDGAQEEAITTARGDRKLMRDTVDEMVGGVGAGLAAYLRVDPVWVRLSMVILTFATSGLMVVIYLVLWAIMPPAKTAAERLQMKGKPVTLESLQEESALHIRQDKRKNVVLFALRVTAAMSFVLVAIGVMIGLASLAYHLLTGDRQIATTYEQLYMGALFAAGVVFAIFCSVIARALFVNRYTKQFWIVVASLVVLGLGLFAAGVLGFVVLRHSVESDYTKNATQKSLDATQVKGAKRLVVQSELPVTINYNVDPNITEVTAWYNKAKTKQDPQINLTRNSDGNLSVNVPMKGNHCLPDVGNCLAQLTVTIVGPELESVTANGGSLVYYIVDTQENLSIATRASGQVELQSTGVINHLQATLSNESRINMTRAGIKNLTLTVEDALSNADIATVDALTATIPTACAANHGGGIITVAHANTATVNGQTYDPSKKVPMYAVYV